MIAEFNSVREAFELTKVDTIQPHFTEFKFDHPVSWTAISSLNGVSREKIVSTLYMHAIGARRIWGLSMFFCR